MTGSFRHVRRLTENALAPSLTVKARSSTSTMETSNDDGILWICQDRIRQWILCQFRLWCSWWAHRIEDATTRRWSHGIQRERERERERQTDRQTDRETDKQSLTWGLAAVCAVSAHSSGDTRDPTETASWRCDNALMSSWSIVIIDNNKRNCADSSQSMPISKVTVVNGSLAWVGVP